MKVVLEPPQPTRVPAHTLGVGDIFLRQIGSDAYIVIPHAHHAPYGSIPFLNLTTCAVGFCDPPSELVEHVQAELRIFRN